MSSSDDEEAPKKTHDAPTLKERALVPIVFTSFVIIRALDRVFLYRVQIDGAIRWNAHELVLAADGAVYVFPRLPRLCG